MLQPTSPAHGGGEAAAPAKGNPLRRFQDRLRGSLGRDGKDGKEHGRLQEAHPDGAADGDAAAAAADARQGRLSPRAHPGVARVSVPDTLAAGPAHSHPAAQQARQEPKAKGQVVGRMGVGVASRGVGGLDTAQPAGAAVGAASTDDYGVHPACVPPPHPATSPSHKRNSSGHGVMSRALQAVKSKVARGDHKPRGEAGHMQEGLHGGGRRQQEPAMVTAFAAAPDEVGNGGGGGFGGGRVFGSDRTVDDALPAAAHDASLQANGGAASPELPQRQAARADAEAEVADAKQAASKVQAAAAGSSSDFEHHPAA